LPTTASASDGQGHDDVNRAAAETIDALYVDLGGEG
jgi:hypothetical protein